LARFLNVPAELQTKTILFEDEKGNVNAAAVRGGYDINETKLMHVAKCIALNLHPLRRSNVSLAQKLGMQVAHLAKEVRIFMDDSMKGRRNFEMGANRTNYHSINVNFGRDS